MRISSPFLFLIVSFSRFSLLTQSRLQKERRLSLSELNALERESQTISVKQRKDALAKKVPEIEQELGELETDLKKLLASETAELNPSGKYYQMAEKLVGSP